MTRSQLRSEQIAARLRAQNAPDLALGHAAYVATQRTERHQVARSRSEHTQRLIQTTDPRLATLALERLLGSLRGLFGGIAQALRDRRRVAVAQAAQRRVDREQHVFGAPHRRGGCRQRARKHARLTAQERALRGRQAHAGKSPLQHRAQLCGQSRGARAVRFASLAFAQREIRSELARQ